MKRVSDAYYAETWDDVHDCDEKKEYHAQDQELGYGLGVYPKDTEIFKTNGEWWLVVEEFHFPIKSCPFCGKRL